MYGWGDVLFVLGEMYWDVLKFIEDCGFLVNFFVKKCESVVDIFKVYSDIEIKCLIFGYDIDGMVYKVD